MTGRRQGVICGLVVSASLAAAAPAAFASTKTPSAVTEVRVTFTKNHLAVSRTGAPSGEVTFVVANHDAHPHVFAVDGPGVKTKTPLLTQGKTAKLTVQVRSGAYMLLDTLSHSFAAHWLVVRPAVDVTASGNGSVVTPITVTTGMNCD